MSRLTEIASNYETIRVVCHPNADPDCLGSAFAIMTSLKGTFPGKDIAVVAPDGIGAVSSKLVSYLGLAAEESLPEATGLVILVDMPSMDQIPSVKEAVKAKRIPYVLIDHHVRDKAAATSAIYSVIRRKSSACEIVYGLLDKSTMDVKVRQGLVTGIVYDSRRFLLPPDTSIRAVAGMIRKGASLRLAVEMLTNEQDASEKMARLKGASRVKLYKAGDWLIAFSRVGSYEASVARALTDIGADLAFIIHEDKAALRLTSRSTDKFYKRTGLNLSRDVMKPLADAFAGQGGGHPTAASVNLSATADEVTSETLSLVSSKLGLSEQDLKAIHTKK